MYLVAVLFAAFVCFSCSDDDDNDDVPAEFSGTWKFDKTHFIFDYSEETITLPIPGMDPMTPEEVTAKVIDLGDENMGKYFTGIRFEKNKKMVILMNINEEPQELNATYEVKGSNVDVTLNKDEFGKLIGQELAIMPAISLQYTTGTGNLTLYINKAYIQALLSAVSQLDLGLPAEVKLILAAVTPILNKTNKLEIGATLKR